MLPKTYFHDGDLPFAMKSEREVGIDTELTGLNIKRDHLCLVQVAMRDANEVHLIRPSTTRARNLCRLLEDQQILKIFHLHGQIWLFCKRISIVVRAMSGAPRSRPSYCRRCPST